MRRNAFVALVSVVASALVVGTTSTAAPVSAAGDAPSTPIRIAALPPAPAPPAPTSATWPREPGAGAGWLEALNYYRALGGAAPVIEDPALSAADLAHATYTLAVGRLAHDQNIPHPTASPAGLRAAQHSNGWASSGTGQAQREPVDAWVSSIGHSLTMLRPEMQTTGFAMLQNPSSTSGLKATAWLDVYSGPERARNTQVLTMPIDQAVIDADVTPIATAHVVATCPGYRESDRLPVLWVRLPDQPGVPTVEVRRDGVVIPSCAFSGANYANGDPSWGPFYRGLLTSTPIVGIVLSERYRVGSGYQVSMSVPTSTGTRQVAWAYRVASPSAYTPLAPRRLVDTRPSEPQGAIAVTKRPVTSGAGVLWVRVAGWGGVPSVGVEALSLNVTAISPMQDGFVSVYPCVNWNDPWPGTASVNLAAGATVSNAVITPVSSNGHICVIASSETHVVIDVNGVFEAGSSFRPVTPRRMFDTRPGQPPALRAVSTERIGGPQVLRVRATGVGDVPAGGVAAVSLNVVAVEPAAGGYLTVYPCPSISTPVPNVASVNYSGGDVVANAVIAPVSADGFVCLASSRDTHVVVDVNGWFAAGAGFVATPAARMFDTRASEPQGLVTVARQRIGGPGRILRVDVTGVGGVPEGARAVSVNVTAVRPSQAGYLTVYPCAVPGQLPPLAANITFPADGIVPNAVITPVSADGFICLFSNTDVDVVVDVNGAFAS
jgi:uncharacterized protein YkwD